MSQDSSNNNDTIKLIIALAVITIVLLLSSCITETRCNRLYPPEPSTNTQDSIVMRDIIVYRDTTVYVPVASPPDTVEKVIKVTARHNKVYSDTIIAETRFAKAVAWVYSSKLNCRLTDKDTGVLVKLDSALVESKFYQELYHTELNREVKTVKYIPSFYRFCLWWFIGTVMFILIFIGLKVYVRRPL